MAGRAQQPVVGASGPASGTSPWSRAGCWQRSYLQEPPADSLPPAFWAGRKSSREQGLGPARTLGCLQPALLEQARLACPGFRPHSHAGMKSQGSLHRGCTCPWALPWPSERGMERARDTSHQASSHPLGLLQVTLGKSASHKLLTSPLGTCLGNRVSQALSSSPLISPSPSWSVTPAPSP